MSVVDGDGVSSYEPDKDYCYYCEEPGCKGECIEEDFSYNDSYCPSCGSVLCMGCFDLEEEYDDEEWDFLPE